MSGTPSSSGNLLLKGTILTPDQVIDGEVLVEGDKITCVAAGDQCASDPGAVGATVVDTHGIIAPGLIDTHNHILFDVFDEDDWKPSKVYTNHNQWTTEARYAAMLDVKQCLVNDSQGKPTWCANTPYGTAGGEPALRDRQVGRAEGARRRHDEHRRPARHVGGVLRLARALDRRLAEWHSAPTRSRRARCSHRRRRAPTACAPTSRTASTKAYLIHVGEGTDARALGEFATLSSVTTTPGCLLAPQTTITHGVAFTASEFATMAQKGMKLTWSPASNVSLYGRPPTFRRRSTAGVTVALAPDWSMGGSQNLLDEMRFADAWDGAHWSNRLSPQDLLTMTTTNAAAARRARRQDREDRDRLLRRHRRVRRRHREPLRRDPRRDAEGRAARDGRRRRCSTATPRLSAAQSHSPACETLDVCGVPKFLCVATADTTNKLNQTYAEIKAALEKALTDADAQTPADGYDFAPLTPLVKCP